MHQLGQMVFDRLEIDDEEWRRTIGAITRNCSIMIDGTSGNGKTTAILRLITALCDCVKPAKPGQKLVNMRATYVSFEEGISGTMQDAMRREGIIEKYSGRIVLAGNATLDGAIKYFAQRGSPEIAVFDSVDYCNMSVEQYKYLREKLKNKLIILISWSQGSRPKSQAARDIQYMVDVKLHVKNFMLWPRSRYGGNEPYIIWEERARLLEQKYFDLKDKAAKNNAKCSPVTIGEVSPAVPEIAEIANEERGVSAHD